MTAETKEIVEYLRTESCDECIYGPYPGGDCSSINTCVLRRAADLIEHLADVAEKSSVKATLYDAALEAGVKIQKELEIVKQERDAAVADLKAIESADGDLDFCKYCKHNIGGKCDYPQCNPYAGKSAWEWRGLRNENI